MDISAIMGEGLALKWQMPLKISMFFWNTSLRLRWQCKEVRDGELVFAVFEKMRQNY